MIIKILTNYEQKCMMKLNQDIGIPVWKYKIMYKQMFI